MFFGPAHSTSACLSSTVYWRMSAPISINPTSSRVASSPPSSPGLYVPIHKRADSSNPSSPSSTTSTLPPSKHIFIYFSFHHAYDAAIATTPSYVYSRDTLLSLLPFADEGMKGKMRVTCPEVVMNRKMRKGLEFNGKRTELLAAQQLLTQEPTLANVIHNKIPTPTLHTPTTNPVRVLPRRSRPAGRAQERRRNVFASSFGARRTGDDSWRLQAVPMSPVLLVWGSSKQDEEIHHFIINLQ